MRTSDEKRQLAKSSNQFLDDVRDLRELEEEKRTEPISTPRFHELAEKIIDKSRAIMNRAILQEDLGDDTETGELSIDDINAGPGGPRADDDGNVMA